MRDWDSTSGRVRVNPGGETRGQPSLGTAQRLTSWFLPVHSPPADVSEGEKKPPLFFLSIAGGFFITFDISWGPRFHVRILGGAAVAASHYVNGTAHAFLDLRSGS